MRVNRTIYKTLSFRLALRQAAYKALTDSQGEAFTADVSSGVGIHYKRGQFQPWQFFGSDSRDITPIVLASLRS